MKRKTLAWFGLLYLSVFVVVVLAAAANGFVATQPDTRYGDSDGTLGVGTVGCGKFLVPSEGSSVKAISKIGSYICENSSLSRIRYALYTHDSANNAPDSVVENSATGELNPGSSYYDLTYDYTTAPEVDAGGSYWICVFGGGDTSYISRYALGGTSVAVTGQTYPTWPSGDTFHVSTGTRDYSFYAVFSDVTTSTTSTSTTSTTSTTTTAGATTTTIRRNRMSLLGVG